MTRRFIATKVRVANRGVAPDSFLNELVQWAGKAPDDIFAPNAAQDVYGAVQPILGPWQGILHRKAAMLEVMRVHAGFESSWNWNEGVDVTNKTSMQHIEGQEAGIFQVSFDSQYIGNSAMRAFAEQNGIAHPETFIPKMKSDHPLALEYYARLVRVSIAWAGPLLRHGSDSVYPWLSRAAVAELEGFLQ